MTKIKVRNGESFDHALRRFTQAVRKAGTLNEVRLRDRYVKKSEIERQRKKAKEMRIRRDRRRR